ncbi:MAG: winged helix DNA-binding protein [Planctomycetota bacterium]|nr:winged helix DNA-binding protein [Planctomycetota bacterium]
MEDKQLAGTWLTNLHVLRVMVSEVLEGNCPLPELDSSLTYSQVNLLKLVQRGCDEEQGWSLRKLARYMQVSLPAVSKNIGRLTPLGFLEVKSDSQDGRKRRVRITERGVQALASFEQCCAERMGMLMGFGAGSKLDEWNASLETMVEVLMRLCREGHVPGLACDCPDGAAHDPVAHAPDCPARRYLHHLDPG